MFLPWTPGRVAVACVTANGHPNKQTGNQGLICTETEDTTVNKTYKLNFVSQCQIDANHLAKLTLMC